MSATKPLCYLIGIHPAKFSKEENFLLEAELFLRICEELKEIFRHKELHSIQVLMKILLVN